MKDSKSRRDDGIKKEGSSSRPGFKKEASGSTSGDDAKGEKPKRVNAASSFKSYRDNRSKDALAKKSFVKKTVSRPSRDDSGDHGDGGGDHGDAGTRPAKRTGTKTGTFSRIGSGRQTTGFNSESNRSSTGYKGPMADRESTSFRGKSESRAGKPAGGERDTFRGKSDAWPPRQASGDRESTGYKGKSDSRSARPGDRESTGYKGKSDSRSARTGDGDSTGYKGKSDSRSARTGDKESTGYKGKTEGSARTKYGEKSSSPITRGAERARAPRRDAAERSDAPRDSRPFASRNSEDRSTPSGRTPYKGSKAESTYLAGKPGRSKSFDFEDEGEAKPVKRNAAKTHYSKPEPKAVSYEYEKSAKPKRASKSRAPEPEFNEYAEASYASAPVKERKPRATKTEFSASADSSFAPVKERKPRAAKTEFTASADSEYAAAPVKERKPRAAKTEFTASADSEYAAAPVKERKPRAAKAEFTASADSEYAAAPVKERKPRAAKSEFEESFEAPAMERKSRAEKPAGTFKERQTARNKESAAAAKEAKPAKRLSADFDEYKNSIKVSSGSGRPYDKAVKPSRSNSKVDQAAERYSKGAAKPAQGTRLNKYIANSGLCARRKADEMIANGEIRVNGVEITEMGYIVQPGDKVQFHDKVLKAEEMVYVLMNKPKDFITTTDDPQERRTVMELLNGATPHRIYPVGRLDRNTTGLLLFTNDGGLAEKLSHPSSNINKLYHVTLDKPMTKVDFDKVTEGITLEDGPIVVDELSFVEGMSKKEVGIRIHSGKNRVVRRIFESMGYDVLKLDRVIYAGLSKKDLTRGRWRHLSAKEIISLKHFTK